MHKFASVIKRNFRVLLFGIALNRGFFCARLFLTVYGCIITLINMVIPRYLIDAVSAGSIKTALIVLSFSFAVNMIGALIDRVYSPYAAVQTEKMNVKITEGFLEKSFLLKLSTFEDEDAYNRYSIAFDNCSSIVHTSLGVFFGAISSLLNLVLAFSVIAWINKGVFAFMLLIIFVLLAIDRRRKKTIYDYQVSVTNDNRKLNYIYRLFYVPQFMRDIRVNSLKDFVFQKKDEATDDMIRKVEKSNKTISNVSLAVSSITNIETMLTSLYFVYETIVGTISVGNFFVALNAYSTIKGSISGMLSSYNEMYSNNLYIERYDEFMTSADVMEDTGKEVLEDVADIEFRNVSFSYPNTGNKALDNVSFFVKGGSKVIIVGSNGAGKTTIVKLLLRLYDPDEGDILINGKSIKDYAVIQLRKAFFVLFQDYSIYPFSIKENVSLGRKVDDKKVADALSKVKMLKRIMSLENGLDTPITSQLEQNGVEFSGGESQRIAIARMFVADSKMMILDEPTSSLDAVIENELYSDIINDAAGKSIIVISHRLIFAHKMDRIICLNDGQIEEDGTHDELMNNQNGLYRKMVEINASKYA